VFATLAMLDSPLINQQGLEVQMGCVIRYCWKFLSFRFSLLYLWL
jgi:hypothetical protein